MQAVIVTRFCRAVDLRRASHVDEARYFPCFMRKLLCHDRTEVVRYISSPYCCFWIKDDEKLGHKFCKFGSS